MKSVNWNNEKLGSFSLNSITKTWSILKNIRKSRRVVPRHAYTDDSIIKTRNGIKYFFLYMLKIRSFSCSVLVQNYKWRMISSMICNGLFIIGIFYAGLQFPTIQKICFCLIHQEARNSNIIKNKNQKS